MNERVEAAAKAIGNIARTSKAAQVGAEKALAAADAVMFSDENEAWVATIIAGYGVTEPFACASEVIAALKGAGDSVGGYIPHANIPDEAVEAAAEAFGNITGTYSRYAAEAILQAAAEHIMAPLVDFLDELEAVDTSVRNYVTVHRLRSIIGSRK